jgi:hypothetical protein
MRTRPLADLDRAKPSDAVRTKDILDGSSQAGDAHWRRVPDLALRRPTRVSVSDKASDNPAGGRGTCSDISGR